MINSKDYENKIEVSIVVLTCNRQESLVRTLEALFNQTYPRENYEIIIVDGGSTDDTETILQEIIKNHENVIFIKQKKTGLGSARNLGISHSKGDIIGFTDDDCIPSTTWIESALPYFNNNNVCGVQGITLPLKKISNKKKTFAFTDVAIFRGNEKTNAYPTCNIFYYKKNLIKVDCFNEEFHLYGEDTDLALRLLERGYIINLCLDAVVYHEVRYLNIFNFIKRKKRLISYPLLIKKHPEIRKTFTFGFIYSRIYPIFLIISLISLLFISKLFFIFALVTLLLYLRSRVVVDYNLKMYLVRILVFYRYILVDTASIYYLLKGSIKYRCLVI